MIQPLESAWRARHVLLIGRPGRPCAYMQALLDALGAKCARISPSAGAEAMCRAMQAARVSAVIVPEMRALAPRGHLIAQLSALQLLLGECREAGVPLVLFLSDAAVYRAAAHPWLVSEEEPVGGETEDGLNQTILQLFADGVSRGLTGDAVHTLCLRHPPLLGCGHPDTDVYTQWCAALDAGERLTVPHPGRQALFVSPLDIFSCALKLGARFFGGDTGCTGLFNIAAGTECAAANRTAALRFARIHGCRRPILETTPPESPSTPLLDGRKAQRLVGAYSHTPADEALTALLQLERAARCSPESELEEIARQAQSFLKRMVRET